MTPYYEQDGITIYHGDNCDVMGHMPRESVDLVVTSPPYDDLRTYGGHSWDFYGVAWQLKRVLKPGGVIVWVVADATIEASETLNGFRQALHWQSIGLCVETMIYGKTGVDPNVGKNPRYAQMFEYMFILSKGKPKTFNGIKARNALAGKRRGIPTKMQRNGEVKSYGANAARSYAEESILPNIWIFDTGAASQDDQVAFDHPAPFPEGLARDHILSWSNPGDVVLDPFVGSGTTLKACKEQGRVGVGIEVNESYCEIAKKRLAQGVLFGASA